MNDPIAAIVQPAEARHPQYGASRKVKRPARDPRPPLDNRAALRVKIKSLAEEQKIIRREETRTGSIAIYTSLHQHRIVDVRPEARAAHLAMCFIKGTPYPVAECQNNCTGHELSVLETKVARLVKKFGTSVDQVSSEGSALERVQAWFRNDSSFMPRKKFWAQA